MAAVTVLASVGGLDPMLSALAVGVTRAVVLGVLAHRIRRSPASARRRSDAARGGGSLPSSIQARYVRLSVVRKPHLGAAYLSPDVARRSTHARSWASVTT
jgi:hypothetical protein